MKLLVISSAPIISAKQKIFMYAPYQKEMKIWAEYTDEIQFCCPVWKESKGLLVDEISFSILPTSVLKEFNITSILKIPLAVYYSIINFVILFKAIKSAHHIHLRCPGNIGLLGSIIQIFFPKKIKTAKYAGNWDPKAKQPWSYRLQKWILSSTFLTKNMQVLVYGEWPNQSKNIKPFFTATYSQSEIQNSKFKIQNSIEEDRIQFLFVGTLSQGKKPLYAVQLVEQLFREGKKATLSLYGEGSLRNEIENYITYNRLENIISLKGNQSKEVLKEAYQNSHFLILPSKSEGWPKAVAEAMFWGCLPIVTPVSCVPFMVANGTRGILLRQDIQRDVAQIENIINNNVTYLQMSQMAQQWSQQFTIEKFEVEISKLLQD